MMQLLECKETDNRLVLINKSRPSSIALALQSFASTEADWLILASDEIFEQAWQELQELHFWNYDVIHVGLALGAESAFQNLQNLVLNWFFLNPSHARPATSWKATSHFVAIRPAILKELGGIDLAYTDETARLMDAVYRILTTGGRVISMPLGGAHENSFLPFDSVNNWIFCLRHFGFFLSLYGVFLDIFQNLSPIASIQKFWQALNRIRRIKAPKATYARGLSVSRGQAAPQTRIGSISAIIPTLNRYEYLPQAIDSLLQQSRPPDEIIVVDQSPLEKRKTELYEAYASKIKLVFLDTAGQSTARNAGLEAATGDWILFFDDDSLAWEDMIEQHILAVENFDVSISTGVTLAPWKDKTHLPAKLQHFHIPHVLDTGNSFVRKDLLASVGGFDKAFDKGSGADNDLGTRLFLMGEEILFNPKAIRTHYKASSGGLRTYGAWWPGKSDPWKPFPQPTQVYTVQKYYQKPSWFPLYLSFYILSKRRYSWFSYFLLWIGIFWKLPMAIHQAKQLKQASESA
jgi:glycosyltransferase involved in cell wall biosynthesis